VLVGSVRQLTLYRYSDGSKAASIDLPGTPVANGVAVAGGKVIVCCQNGAVVCLGP
jgi:hypothetical protein